MCINSASLNFSCQERNKCSSRIFLVAMGLRDAIQLFISCSEKFSQLFFTVGRSTLISDDPSKPGGHQYLAMFISFLFLSTRIQMLKHPPSSKCPNSFHGNLRVPLNANPPPRKSFPSKSCDFKPKKTHLFSGLPGDKHVWPHPASLENKLDISLCL